MAVTAKQTNPYQDRVQTAKSLFGILPIDADIDYSITRNVKDYQDADGRTQAENIKRDD